MAAPPSGSTARISGPSDIKELSATLSRAGYPLNEGQINFLQTLKTGPEFTRRMGEVLTESQINAVRTSSSGRGGGGRGGR